MTRRQAAFVTLGAIALGIVSRKVPLGFVLWDKSLGDALYAVMIFGIVVFVRPRTTPLRAGVIAFAICLGLELFQLTGIPKTLPRPLRIAIGDTFSWHDIVCYAVGSLVTSLVLSASCSRRARRPSPRSSLSRTSRHT